MIFLCYPKCTTCQKAKKWLDENHIAYDLRDIKLETMGLKDKLPHMNEDEALRLLATNGMLVKRPLLVGDDFVLAGFREADWTKRLKTESMSPAE